MGEATSTCRRSLELMASGDAEEFASVYTADAENRESVTEPPVCRTRGPDAFVASARWMHRAFSELRWEVHDAAEDDDNDLVVLHTTMTGRQTGPFVAWTPDADVAMVFPSRGRTFAVTQTHWFRMVDGRIAEHWANRDDLALGQQLGWNPPPPHYLARMLLARARLRREVAAGR